MTAESVRLVVWDLDETFWKGTLTEGGITEYVQAHHDIVIALARLRVSRYESVMREIVSAYPYAAVVGFSELVRNPKEAFKFNHYTREVFVRLVERIAEVAAGLAPRADVDDPMAKAGAAMSFAD